MKFAHPQYLYWLPIVWLALGLGWKMATRRQQRLLEKFAGQGSPDWADAGFSSRRKIASLLLGWVAIGMLLAALARPLYFVKDDRDELRGTPYLIALDASRSMLATDIKPNRYTSVTNALDRYFADTRADNIGIITFSGVAYLNAPLTFDMTALRTILGYINPQAMVDPGSSLSAALDRAARYFTSNSLPQRTLVLITDGEDLDGNSLELTRKLHRDHKITVHAIGVGTLSGSPIPAYRAKQGTNAAPEITTRLNENNLRRIANAGGGHYYRLGSNGEGLQRLREEVIQPLAENAARNDLRNYREAYYVPLLMAMIALLLQLLTGADRHLRRRPLPSIMQLNS